MDSYSEPAPLTPHHRDTLLAVLDYWHKVEFFIPYGLEQYLGELEPWQVRALARAELADPTNPVLLRVDVDPSMEVVGYNLFLGVFDRSAIGQVGDLCEGPNGPLARFEDEARADLEGLTCFAKLPLDVGGYPLLDALSISTAPWALGQALGQGLGALSYDAFDSAKRALVIDLQNFLSARGGFAGHGLQPAEVLTLHALLCAWAGFTPEAEQPIAMLTAKVRPGKQSQSPAKEAAVQAPPEPSEAEDEDELALDDLDILNSFYISDLERAIQAVRRGEVPATLERYLIPLAAEQRIDLYSEQGCMLVQESLRPRHMNEGHWLAAPGHAMSLMQQFAINQIRGGLACEGLFSVNGPPGTGKTTLLRDLFADNLVQRAKVLAGLVSADAAFSGESLTVHFKGDDQSVKLRPLIAALTGFEMVVASTNNAAVENISLDLVKRRALDTTWKQVGYLQPVAHNLAIQQARRGPVSPEGEDMPWGLFSCALGNARNRNRFLERFGMYSLETDSAELPLRIWDWFKGVSGQSFSQAQEAFRVAQHRVTEALAKREALAELLAFFTAHTEASHTAEAQEAETQADQALAEIIAAQAAQAQRQQAVTEVLQQLATEQALIDRTRPGWWARLRRTPEARAYALRRSENAAAQLDAHAQLRAFQPQAQALTEQLASAQARLEKAQAVLAERRETWTRKAAERDRLVEQLGTPRLPAAPLALRDDPALQIHGLWHDEALATLRSALFAAALALHEAWLHEAGQGALRSNLVAVGKLLSGKKPEDRSQTLAIWQNLFMVVPVVSSTFASFANQFTGLGASSLGWVYIDEAGQAVPQAAVGAIWRARRCVVVGDPLQIEPVFTLPTRLINALGQLSPVTAGNAYAPHCVSVQRLADLANRFGANAPFMEETLWVGSPLRVHRRCHEPMFSLANQIAYGGRMVYGLRDRSPGGTPLIDLPSGWVDIQGAVQRKQAVPEQVEFMVKVITHLYQRDQQLPPLYVISPFKAVRQALREQLLAFEWPSGGPRRDELNRWAMRSIGTVHTFQGKEEGCVFMVLGADRDNAGSAKWAASKPNLLNVALTRAQQHIYLVGDRALWGELPYFQRAAVGPWALPRLARQDFAIIRQRPRVVDGA